MLRETKQSEVIEENRSDDGRGHRDPDIDRSSQAPRGKGLGHQENSAADAAHPGPCVKWLKADISPPRVKRPARSVKATRILSLS